MRQPTPKSEIYAWWRAALAGGNPPIHEGEPNCGFFRRRLVKGGPWVPAAIWLDQDICDATGQLMRDEQLLCLVAEKMADPYFHWTYLAGNPITEQEYNFMIARQEYAVTYQPDTPHANTSKPIDLLKTPTIF